MKLDSYPKIKAIVQHMDGYLSTRYPFYFGDDPKHPFSPIRKSKVIHDNLWGTNPFSWRELAIIDSPIFQRLRNIHQTGLAYFVYPSAHHTRFEHCLGVATIAGKTFDAIQQRKSAELESIAKELHPEHNALDVFAKWRAELRLAALLHDIGHSLHSHTSEIVYSEIPILKEAASELQRIVGISKGVGEVLSFCISQTTAMANLLTRAGKKLDGVDDLKVPPDWSNVSLLILGRSSHPKLQFLGDVISSDFDADKLDYLLRDATFAGLPLRYDLERYLYTISVSPDRIRDDEKSLQELYAAIGITAERTEKGDEAYYDSVRLTPPKQAMSTLEQIVICKFMLFSYIYHHRKVRASEGMLARMLQLRVKAWADEGLNDLDVLDKFLDMTDTALDSDIFGTEKLAEYRSRLVTRRIPREVLGFAANHAHNDGKHVSALIYELLNTNSTKRQKVRQEIEDQIATELKECCKSLKGDPDILFKAGVWLDVPKPPDFEKAESVVVGDQPGVQLKNLFPIGEWVSAYLAYRYHIRIFSFSEYRDDVELAVRRAFAKRFGIDPESPYFAECTRRVRNLWGVAREAGPSLPSE